MKVYIIITTIQQKPTEIARFPCMTKPIIIEVDRAQLKIKNISLTKYGIQFSTKKYGKEYCV